MQKDAMGTNVSSEGFLLLDSSMNPIFEWLSDRTVTPIRRSRSKKNSENRISTPSVCRGILSRKGWFRLISASESPAQCLAVVGGLSGDT